MLKRSSIVSSAAVFLAAWMAPAAAQLSAVFSGNVTAVCVTSTAGFDANLRALGPSFISSSVSAGTLTFNSDGTGTLANKILGIGHSATAPGSTPAVQSESTCPFTYLYDGSSFHVSFGTCPGVTLTGPGAGQQAELTGLRAQYLLMDRGSTLVAVGMEPAVETFRNLTTGFTAQRICHRAGNRFR